MSVLQPAGPGAAPVTAVWWAMFWGAAAITLGMAALGLYAMYRPRGRTLRSPRALLFGGGLVLPLVVIAALLAWGLPAGNALLPRGEPGVLQVEVTARQWWWQSTYPGAPGGARHAAGVVHIPAGQPVDLVLHAGDVIHSFWVPRLGGKTDAIPGRRNVLRLQADAPGRYRGQCAEFCGLDHARMAFEVVAHAPADFAAVLQGLPTTAPTAADGLRARAELLEREQAREAAP